MNAQQLLEEMADLESRIAVIYERFASEFRDASDVSDLWASMSREELQHADLLSRAAAGVHGVAVTPSLAEHVRRLQAVVVRYEGEQANIVQLQDALRATADLEEAEAEHLHGHLDRLGDAARALVENPAMRHRLRNVLDHAMELFGTPALRGRVAWRRFHD
jgi:hypothetical protein